MTLAWLLITALTAAMTVAVGVAAASDGTVLAVLVSLYAVLCGGTAYVVTRHIRTIDRFGVMGGGNARFGKRWDKAATVAMVLVGVSVIFSFPVGLGAALPYLVRSCGRYAPGERYERRRFGLEG
ncbi:hypothetical protein [Streptomyces huiliensis]|uniref:hypothetical protein n=1 Tax=Streptomyces huiliensis TaxID=2876027 RepID=UPI001CBD0E8E|nr:hypothetical protein [Streptomyces huiliensis]MBZ4318079.1 hypothetical protein [Streptomyces huiliensis]